LVLSLASNALLSPDVIQPSADGLVLVTAAVDGGVSVGCLKKMAGGPANYGSHS
jgi:hypothetical protein